ncbi:hypothetical protein ACFX2H_044240 [Malus domestica]
MSYPLESSLPLSLVVPQTTSFPAEYRDLHCNPVRRLVCFPSDMAEIILRELLNKSSNIVNDWPQQRVILPVYFIAAMVAREPSSKITTFYLFNCSDGVF